MRRIVLGTRFCIHWYNKYAEEVILFKTIGLFMKRAARIRISESGPSLRNISYFHTNSHSEEQERFFLSGNTMVNFSMLCIIFACGI